MGNQISLDETWGETINVNIMKRDVFKTEFSRGAYNNPIAMVTLVLQVAYMKQDHLKTLGPYFVPRLQP